MRALKRAGLVALVAAGVTAIVTPHALAQSLSVERERNGTLDYSVSLRINNTTSKAICDFEVQVTSLNDEIAARSTPSGWSAAGPENNAVAWGAANAGNCVPAGGSKTGFRLVIDGVLPVDLHVCFLDASGVAVGACQAVRVR